jgi:hypothetical protein
MSSWRISLEFVGIMPLLKKPPEIVLRSDAPFGAGAAATRRLSFSHPGA